MKERKKTKAQIFTKPFNILWIRFSVVPESSVSEVFTYLSIYLSVVSCFEGMKRQHTRKCT